MRKLLVSELIHAINGLKEEEIITQIVLSTLEEQGELTTVMVDRIATIGQHTVTLVYEVILDEDENGKLVCSGVDPNTENTWVHLDFKDTVFEFEECEYDSSELANLTSFKELILASQIQDLTFDTVNHILKKILIDYAVSSNESKS